MSYAFTVTMTSVCTLTPYKCKQACHYAPQRGTPKPEIFVCAAAAFTHHQCIFGSFIPFPVGGTLPLDAVLQNPRVLVDVLEGQSLVRVQHQQLY